MSPYCRTLRVCQAMASTVGGQRRILKQNGTVIDYIRKAVQTGVYRTQEEFAMIQKQRKDGIEDLRIIMNRLRQDIVRGSHVQDYPTEYLILEQHPPIPDPPRTPIRLMRRLFKPKPSPIDDLTKKYIDHFEHDGNLDPTETNHSHNANSDSRSGPTSSEDYYRRLLGVQAAKKLTKDTISSSGLLNLQQKPALIQRAYAAAILHYQIQRESRSVNRETGNTSFSISDHDAMEQVDALLAQQTLYEQKVSSERKTNIVKYQRRNKTRPTTDDTSSQETLLMDTTSRTSTSDTQDFPFRLDGSENTDPSLHDHDTNEFNKNSSTNTTAAATMAHKNTYESIFSSDTMTIQGMMRWSERLNAVPYGEWTIGASTALDHWVARQVLNVSEETWQCTLEGYDPSLLSIGRDIIACREALFPETIIHASRVQEELDAAAQEEAAATSILSSDATDENAIETDVSDNAATEDKEAQTIEDLLRRLGGLRAHDAPPGRNAPASDSNNADAWRMNENDVDTKIDQLVRELQNWRRRNVETPYDDWEPVDQERLNEWVKTYVYTVSSEAERRRLNRSQNNPSATPAVDYEQTRIALLSDPPLTEDESHDFWIQLRNESTVEALLDSMIEDGPPPGASILHASFWDLPRSLQVERLLNLGAIRPLLDEYTKESDRLRFLQRYGDTMLIGVPLEHLVADPSGPIMASDLSRDIKSALRISENERFRLERLPYKAFADENKNTTKEQQDTFEKSRLLFKAWNEHKAGRARYEERLFQIGELGLRYSDPVAEQGSGVPKPDSSMPKGKRNN